MEKQALVECPNCKKLNALTGEHRHLEVAIELGMVCQHCKEWMHFGYYTPELIERRKQLTNHRKRRAFKRDYDAFQVEIEKALTEAEEYIENIEPVAYDYVEGENEPV